MYDGILFLSPQISLLNCGPYISYFISQNGSYASHSEIFLKFFEEFHWKFKVWREGRAGPWLSPIWPNILFVREPLSKLLADSYEICKWLHLSPHVPLKHWRLHTQNQKCKLLKITMNSPKLQFWLVGSIP